MSGSVVQPNELSVLLKALGHETRLNLLDIIHRNQDCNVSKIETLSGVGQPALSQQLAVLRKAELVSTRRQAKQIHYRVNKDRMDAIVDALKLYGSGDRQSHNKLPSPPPSGAAGFARIIQR